jgi:arsenate reductase
VKFLRDHQIKFEELPIRETPPSLAELKSMLEGRSVKALFNTSGLDYKALGLSRKLPEMSLAETLGLLATNGNLVKRPFAIGNDVRLVGFDENLWKSALV